MATRSILLPIGAATLPDNTTGNAMPRIRRVKSSATAPAPFFLQANFNSSTSEHLFWSFQMPVDYASDPVLKVLFKMDTATTGAVVIEGRIMAQTSGDSANVDAAAFGSANTSSAETVPGTAGHLDDVSVALTNDDSVAAEDFVVVMLGRDADAAADTASNDMEVVAVTLEYTAG